MARKPKRQQPDDAVAETPAVEQSQQQTLAREKNHMSDDNIPSVIEYSSDISEAEAPPLLPAGDYPGEIIGAVRKQGPKAEYADVTFRISAEAYPADFTDGDEEGITLHWRRTTIDDTARGRFRMKKFCEAIGASMGRTLDLNTWVGKVASLTLEHQDYEGEKQLNIKKVNPA